MIRALSLLLAMTLATVMFSPSDAQVPSGSKTPSLLKTSPLLSSPIWGRPLTVLDYFLMQMYSRLDEQARQWQSTEHSGLWTSPQRSPAYLTPRAFLDQQSGQVILGLDISADRFTKSPGEVCAWMINNSVAEATAAGETERHYRTARNNTLSHLMPRSLYAVTTEQEREAAFDELQQRTVLRASLYEKSTKSFTECERPVLGDSVTVRRRSDAP